MKAYGRDDGLRNSELENHNLEVDQVVI